MGWELEALSSEQFWKETLLCFIKGESGRNNEGDNHLQLKAQALTGHVDVISLARVAEF